jgi:TRAP-type C4-dicarboxylate transport system permease small subunit
MMMPIPTEIIWLLVLLAISALVLAWCARDGRWLRDGRVQPWILFEDLILFFLFMGMFVASSLQILIRYGLSDVITLPWTEEFARLLMVWGALWGAAAIHRSDEHISMTVLFDALPAAGQRWLRLFGDLVTIAALGPLVWLGWETARSLDIMHSISLGLPLSVFAYPIPVVAVLMILHTLRLIWLRWRDIPVPPETGIGV